MGRVAPDEIQLPSAVVFQEELATEFFNVSWKWGMYTPTMAILIGETMMRKTNGF